MFLWWGEIHFNSLIYRFAEQQSSLTIKAVVSSTSVVNAALASVYAQNSKDIKNQSSEQAVASDADAAELAIAMAVQSVTAA
jgi:hypothetical protein